MNTQALVQTMVSVGERYSTSVSDLRTLTVKLVVLSLRYVDRVALWGEIFGGSDPEKPEYVHWDLVERVPPSANVFGDAGAWLALVGVCTWDCLQVLEGEISLNHAPIHGLRKALRSVGLDPGGAEGWTMTCRAYLLSLLQGVPTLHALDLLTCQFFKRGTREACMNLLAGLADSPYTPAQHQATLLFVLTHVAVDKASLESSLRVVRAKREDHKLNLQLRNMTVVQGRPRLRDRATVTQDEKTNADIELQSWQTYKGFTWKHSFPPTLSEGLKTRLYFLASQTTWPWRDHIRAVVQAPAIVAKVAAYPVTRPDVPVLIQVIEALSMDGQAPFQELTDFRQRCFQSFPVSHTQRLTHSQALQLYVAAYQPPSVWKDVWRHLCGVISVQIIKDVVDFTATSTFCAQEVVRLMCRS